MAECPEILDKNITFDSIADTLSKINLTIGNLDTRIRNIEDKSRHQRTTGDVQVSPAVDGVPEDANDVRGRPVNDDNRREHGQQNNLTLSSDAPYVHTCIQGSGNEPNDCIACQRDSLTRPSLGNRQGALGYSRLDTEFLQGEYRSIEDSVRRTRLPSDLRLGNSGRTGIKKQDQPMFNVITKTAGYFETLLKVISLLEVATVREADFQDLFIIAFAAIRYLQEEFALLLVQGSLGQETASVYRCFQRHAGAFPPQSIDTLRNCVAISAAREQQQSVGRRFNQRSRGGVFRGGRQQYQDPYRSFTSNRGFPFTRSQGGQGHFRRDTQQDNTEG